MNDLRTAAQQALEFLDSEFGWSPGEAPRIDALRAALAQEQAEPGREPAAWRITDGEGGWEYRTDLPEDWSIQWSARHGRKYEPLYTAPPKAEPLTEEEIFAIENDIPDAVVSDRAWTIWFARAVERALEEKNRGR